jgi:hypothetical protein
MDDDDQYLSLGDPLVIWSPLASMDERKQHISMQLQELKPLWEYYATSQLEAPSHVKILEIFWDLQSITDEILTTMPIGCRTEIRMAVEEWRTRVVSIRRGALIDNKGRGNQWFWVRLARTTTLFDRESVWVVTQTMVSIGSSPRPLGDCRLLCLDFRIYPGFWGRLSMMEEGFGMRVHTKVNALELGAMEEGFGMRVHTTANSEELAATEEGFGMRVHTAANAPDLAATEEGFGMRVYTTANALDFINSSLVGLRLIGCC